MARWTTFAFTGLCGVAVVGTLVYPTYPNYDSYYSLLWGDEILHGHRPHFEGFRLPTEHPLAIVAGAVLDLFGGLADRLWIILILGAFLALVAGVYRLAATAFTPLIGAVAAVLLLTRFDFAFLAVRGYIDIPYLALVVWAVALEAGRPRRGLPVFALLVAAGLLRPEAWLLLGLYWLWMFPGASWRDRAIWAAVALIAPLGWGLLDGIVTGDPLFSLHHTSDSAEDLGRARSLKQIPSAIPGFLSDIVKPPVMVAGVAGLVAAVLLAPRRAVWPAVLLATGILTFVAIGVAGLSAIERYLVVAALAVLVFASVSVGGWTLLEPSRVRTVWKVAATLLIVGGAVFTVLRLDLRTFDNELTYRGHAHRSLHRILDTPAVRRGLRCGPLTLPNHKLVPDSRWLADLPFERVRSRVKGPAQSRGVALVVLGRFAIFKLAWTNDYDPARVQVPPEGFALAARNDDYAAYVRC
jgi:hypothetical protein